MNFSSDLFDAFKSKLHDVAQQFKGQGIIFLMGDVESSAQAFQVSQNCFLVLMQKISFYADYVLVKMDSFMVLKTSRCLLSLSRPVMEKNT